MQHILDRIASRNHCEEEDLFTTWCVETEKSSNTQEEEELENSINCFKFLLQKNHIFQPEKKTKRNATKPRKFLCVLYNKYETRQTGQY